MTDEDSFQFIQHDEGVQGAGEVSDEWTSVSVRTQKKVGSARSMIRRERSNSSKTPTTAKRRSTRLASAHDRALRPPPKKEEEEEDNGEEVETEEEECPHK